MPAEFQIEFIDVPADQQRKARLGRPAPNIAPLVMEEIDKLAEVLTGDRTYFHLRGGAPSNNPETWRRVASDLPKK